MKNIASKVYVTHTVVLLMILIVSVRATTTNTNTNSTLPLNIPDNNMSFTCLNFPVAGIPSNENVVALSVTFGIEHECVSDMQVELRDPSGTRIRQLFGRVSIGGCPGISGVFDINGIYTFIDTAASTMNSQEVSFIPPGSYRSANYTTTAATSINSLFGAMTATQANGTWQLCGRDIANLDVGRFKDSASISITSFVPTGANAFVRGRVLSPFGSGVNGAIVTLTSPEGASQTVRTNPFGYFIFEDVEVGLSYIISVSSKQYQFNQQFISVNGNIESLSITPQ